MHRSRLLNALVPLAFFGLLALAPTGCSSEADGVGSPGDGLPASGDDVAPATPTGFSVVKATEGGFRLAWAPNTEIDLAGYRVYVYQPSPERENSYVCPHGVSLVGTQQTWYVLANDSNVETWYFKLSAVDQAGNESERYGPYSFHFTPDTWNADRDDTAPNDGDFMPTNGWVEGSPHGYDVGVQDGRPGR
jgi:hypothetical protein